MTDLARYYDESYPPSLWAPPVPPPAPSVMSLTPNTGVISTAVTVTVAGTDFTDQSSVYFNAAEQPTTFVSETELSFTGTLPGTANLYSVQVRDPNGNSNNLPFTVTATAEEEEPVAFAAIPVESPPADTT